MFLDEVVLSLSAGRGGAGSNSLRREKFVPKGGPDGGDGGRGGDVVVRAEEGISSLQRFQLERSFRAQPGRPGEGSKRHGADGPAVTLVVPRGTMVFDADSGQLLADLDRVGAEVVAARGGRGGRGNTHFATATYQAPRRRELGAPGETRRVRLELRLIADLGLVGLPNAGKSTLLAQLTGAHPKIADYPFTTLSPNLGVVDLASGRSLTAADVPGLIEGAHLGAGLGIGFLRHLARTRVLVHVVDASLGPDRVAAAYRQVAAELGQHSADLALKPAVVAVNKIDLLSAEEVAAVLAGLGAAVGRGTAVVPVSASTGVGTEQLLAECARVISAVVSSGEAGSFRLYQGPMAQDRSFEVLVEQGRVEVKGESLSKLIEMTDMEDEASVLRLQRQLINQGVEDALVRAGVAPGSEVTIGKASFTFFPEPAAQVPGTKVAPAR
jgi:GTP-binding protein